MNSAELRRLTYRARTAYAVMCFERFAASVYPGADFRPAAEIMWHMADGSVPAEQALPAYQDILPENLYAFRTFAAYQASGHTRITEAQYRALTSVIKPDDRLLNSIMQLIYLLAAGAADPGAKPGAPDTLPYLENVILLLEVRKIALPDLRLLQSHTFTAQEMLSPQSLDWTGSAVDPAPLSILGITKGACSVTDAPDSTGPDDGNERPFSTGKDDIENVFYRPPEPPPKPCAEASGCKWEYITGAEGCIITRCTNPAGQKAVTVPAELNGRPVTEIDSNAFSCNPDSGCLQIETLVVPDTVRRIGNGFFRGCTGLRQITLSAQLESIGNDAFRGASLLENLTVGAKCRTIGDHFCADAVSLQSVTIGAGIEYIGDYTFYNTPAMTAFRCDGLLRMLGYGSFWMNRWADRILFSPGAEMLRFCRNGALLYRYVRRDPPPYLYFDAGVIYVYDFAFGGDAWHSGNGITDIFFPGAEKIGVNTFKKVPNATVHLSLSRMKAAYGPNFANTLTALCKPARVVFDQP